MKINLLRFVAATLLVATISSSYSQDVLIGKDAEGIIPTAQMLRTSKHSTAPSFVKFKQGKELDIDNFKSWAAKNFKLSSNMGFELVRAENDKLGHKHYRYQQTYNGKPIEHAIWLLHSKNDKIYSMNGLIYPSLSVTSAQGLSEAGALNQALDHVGADLYKWQMPEEEAHVKRESGNPDATYYPSAELVYVSEGGNFAATSYKLAYKFNIYAHAPVSRTDIYIDASTGSILYEDEQIKNIDVPGTAQTAYSGAQTITADSFGGSYRLRETGRGNGVNTYDMNTGTSYGAAVDFTDNDNFWDNANAQLDEYGTDAHWGAEMTYDYYWLVHSRNSIDGNGFALNSYVHYDVLYANAFWDGQRMTYGDGNGGSWDPLTAIDITGHEVTHGLTTFTAGLVYNAESGALNESFSDIFGTAIENYALPADWDWLIGEDIGSALRNMANPNAAGDPDTYFGTNWASLTGGDNGGVHTNSGVQNYWYYLLVDGGSGTNDNADAYNVTGLGFDEASDIAFRNLTVYLTPSSDFFDARFFAIQSAVDLFGGCTPQVESCTNAWYAVGVGPVYVSTVIADMSAPITNGCSAPFTVDFANSSSNGTSFEWDFGDGNTGTGINPSHTYSALGTYTITLIADGGLCGIDTTVWTNYIDIDTSNPCEVIMPTSGSGNLQTACDGTLYDSGGASGDYGPNEDAQITISPLGATTVDINFIFFDVEPGQSGGCNYDYVVVYDGPNTASPLIDTYCNNNTPPGSISSTGDAITIVFHSDPGVEDGGYEISWNCFLPTVPPVADFISNTDTTCNGEISFTDMSTNGPSSWLWDFGDGNTSTAQNPVNDYTSSGSYSVTLTATNVNGADAVTYNNIVVVELPASPTGTDDIICENNAASLAASGTGGDLDWYDSQVGGTMLNTGTGFTTPVLGATTSYWVEENVPGGQQNLGPADNTFGIGAFFNGDQHLVFDVVSPVILKTVRVYANGDGDRNIELRDDIGTVIQAATIFIPDGESIVTLNFDLPAGTDLQLGTQNGSGQDLYRNSAGPSYPYVVGGGEVTITQSSPGTAYYYFYYDWVIESPGCTSERTEVIATVNAAQDATITQVAPMCSGDAAVALTAVDGGGTWSGTGVTGSTFDPSTAGNGTHTITYTIPGMCGDTDQMDIDVADSYDATINSTAVLCTTDAAVTLTAVDGGGTWSGTGITNATTGEFDPATAGPGTHTITYDIVGSCGDNDTEDIIVETTPDGSVNPAGPFCRTDAAYQLVAASSGGTWTADCGACIDAVTGIFDPAVAGAGTWIITYSIGGNCTAQDIIAVAVSDCELGFGQMDISVNIYPNPSNGQFVIQFENYVESSVMITDVTGKLIFENVYSTDKIEMDLANWVAEGTYFLTILGSDGQLIVTHKIQVIR